MLSAKFSDVNDGSLFVSGNGMFRKKAGFGRDFEQPFHLRIVDFNAVNINTHDNFVFDNDEEVIVVE